MIEVTGDIDMSRSLQLVAMANIIVTTVTTIVVYIIGSMSSAESFEYVYLLS